MNLTTGKKLLCTIIALLTAFMTITLCVPQVSAADYSYTGNVIYLSDNGDDSNAGTESTAPKKSLAAAFSAAGKNGTIVVTDVYTYKSHVALGNCTLAGANDKSRFNFGLWGISMSGPLTVKNLNINMTADFGFIIANCHNLIMDENVVITKDDGIKTLLSIRAGGDNKEITKDTHVILKSGSYSTVYGGTSKQNANCNTYITVYGGVTASSITSGNDSPGESVVTGCGVVKLVGDTVNVTKIPANLGHVEGGVYLDISEYDGVIGDAWEISNYKMVCKEKDSLPEPLAQGIAASSTTSATPTTPSTSTADNKPAVKTEVSASEAVYLSDSGDDVNDGKTADKPKKTLASAMKACKDGGTILITDTYTYKAYFATSKKCTIAGVDSSSVINFGLWGMAMGDDLTIKNLHIHMTAAWAFIFANCHDLTIDENVTITKADNVSTFLSIRGGGDNTVSKGNSHITLKSGTYNAVWGGTSKQNFNGNTFITIHEGVSVKMVASGNDSAGESIVSGSGVIKLVGGDVSISSLVASKEVKGGTYLELSEYTGKMDEKWNTSSFAKVCTTADDLPADLKKEFYKEPDKYDLSGEKNLVYLSDSGNDENDGKTAAKPFATLPAAVKALGDEGGTVAITGKYTYKHYVDTSVPLKIVSVSSTDVLSWNLWGMVTRGGLTIENVHIEVLRDYCFILHYGSPITIGENVTCKLAGGAKVLLSIRAGEKDDINGDTNITIKSGSFSSIYSGTKNGSLNGDANITVSGGSVSYVNLGNDGADGRVAGNTIVTLSGNAAVKTVTDRKQSDGYCLVDVSALDSSMPTFTDIENIKTTKGDAFVPISSAVKYISGYPDGTFHPTSNLTRAEAITIVSKLCGLKDEYTPVGNSAFTDIKPEDWYYRNVRFVEDKKIVDFFGAELKPTTQITRAEFVRLLLNLGMREKSIAPTFSDVKEGDLYYDAIIAAASSGLVNGYPDGTFRPNNTITRAEIVTIINRLSTKNVVKSNAVKVGKFSDVDGHWAKAEIIAAACDSTVDGMIIWYVGDKVPELTADEYSKLNFALTDTLSGMATLTDSVAAEKAISELSAKRIAEIASTATAVDVKGTKYYVSEGGDDANDGLSPETAWKTNAKVTEMAGSLKPGDGVFFKRGETFRGRISTAKGVTYSAYGEGAKPNIYGSARNYSEAPFWDATSTANVYVSKEAFSNDVGLIVFDEGKAWSIKKINGMSGFTGTLSADLEMYHNTSDNKLYLCSVSDPNTRFTSTEIAPGLTLVNGNGNDVTIDNLCLKYTGAHGIGYGDGTTGLTVQNCEIGWIGGMIQYMKPDGTAVRYGNGVEIYVNCKDYTVTNCYIYEVYDAGVTHQYFANDRASVVMENIEYSNNVIDRCTYDIEYCNGQSDSKGVMKDVRIYGNILTGSGNGWGNQRPDKGDTVIQGWSIINHGQNFVIYDNIISTDSAKLIRIGVARTSYLPIVIRNVFMGKEGMPFGEYSKNVPKTYTYDANLTNVVAGLADNTFIYKK